MLGFAGVQSAGFAQGGAAREASSGHRATSTGPPAQPGGSGVGQHPANPSLSPAGAAAPSPHGAQTAPARPGVPRQAPGWSWNVLDLRDITEQGLAHSRGGSRCWQCPTAKPIQAQLRPQGEFHREELALGEGYLQTKPSRAVKNLLHFFKAST